MQPILDVYIQIEFLKGCIIVQATLEMIVVLAVMPFEY